MQNKHILIKNIYYMLTYAFRALRQKNFEDIATEDFDNIHNLFAAILSRGIATQLKQGLYREYLNIHEDIATLRGKIEMSGTMQHKKAHRQLLSCEYDELSENIIHNQILKTTAILLVKSSEVDEKYKVALKKEMLFFSGIDTIEPDSISWSSIRFHRNNQAYHMLIGVCQLVLDGMLISEEKGEHKLASFVDDQKMSHLYERFVFEYYKREFPSLKVSSSQISWALDTGLGYMLPVMQSDIMLSKNDKVLIIDTKYYARSVQSQFDSYTQHSHNMYQIFTYVKNKELEPADKPLKVSGMLLYARTDEKIQPDQTYYISGNRIDVKTLDLNCDFTVIQAQLNWIVKDFFRGCDNIQWVGADRIFREYVPPKSSVYAFALRWIEKFKDPKIDYIELVDHYLADECEVLGFEMNRGKAFDKKYRKAVNNIELLKEMIETENDIMLLGSAIYTQWRYYNHWAYDAREILLPDARSWFITILERMAEMSETKVKHTLI